MNTYYFDALRNYTELYAIFVSNPDTLDFETTETIQRLCKILLQDSSRLSLKLADPLLPKMIAEIRDRLTVLQGPSSLPFNPVFASRAVRESLSQLKEHLDHFSIANEPRLTAEQKMQFLIQNRGELSPESFSSFALHMATHHPELFSKSVDRLRIADIPLLLKLEKATGNVETNSWDRVLTKALDESFAGCSHLIINNVIDKAVGVKSGLSYENYPYGIDREGFERLATLVLEIASAKYPSLLLKNIPGYLLNGSTGFLFSLIEKAIREDPRRIFGLPFDVSEKYFIHRILGDRVVGLQTIDQLNSIRNRVLKMGLCHGYTLSLNSQSRDPNLQPGDDYRNIRFVHANYLLERVARFDEICRVRGREILKRPNINMEAVRKTAKILGIPPGSDHIGQALVFLMYHENQPLVHLLLGRMDMKLQDIPQRYHNLELPFEAPSPQILKRLHLTPLSTTQNTQFSELKELPRKIKEIAASSDPSKRYSLALWYLPDDKKRIYLPTGSAHSVYLSFDPPSYCDPNDLDPATLTPIRFTFPNIDDLSIALCFKLNQLPYNKFAILSYQN